MNEILQKRIEEAAKTLINYNLVDLGDLVNQYDLRRMLIEMGVKTLKNQWISVGEALPPKEDNDSSITVLVHCQKGWCGIDYYRYKYGEWLNNGNSVTHWMPIPSLEGGKK